MTKQTQKSTRAYREIIQEAQEIAKAAGNDRSRANFDVYVEEVAKLYVGYTQRYCDMTLSERRDAGNLLRGVKETLNSLLDIFQVRDMRRFLAQREKEKRENDK